MLDHLFSRGCSAFEPNSNHLRGSNRERSIPFGTGAARIRSEFGAARSPFGRPCGTKLRKTRAESRTSISRETDATTQSSCEDHAASRDPFRTSRCTRDLRFTLRSLAPLTEPAMHRSRAEPRAPFRTRFSGAKRSSSRCGHEILSNPMMHARTLVAPRSYEIPFETPRCTHEPVFQARARSRDSILFRGFWLRSSYAFYCVRKRCSHE